MFYFLNNFELQKRTKSYRQTRVIQFRRDCIESSSINFDTILGNLLPDEIINFIIISYVFFIKCDESRTNRISFTKTSKGPDIKF